ncbi:MAG TPA: NUDIX hydrolase [candidate division WOR-3 bacterium]|uniref:NUDIX hydrolase n=1 Tax=candidate division WOR-3 bacterium TaxID=2052148 RepID=A0A7C5M6L8_UNCW3|nr:MAG: ADP-ribose pyrophosphatase [Candidatus Hydrothermae bacterium]HHF58335.1 NUDIX hydrolase [candidate division WOR-3 bacterium]
MKVVESKYMYKGKILNLRVDKIQLPDHEEVTREVVEFIGACAVVPVLDDTIIFVKQYRHPAGKKLLEIPAGKLEPGENIEETAERELKEEIGYRALDLHKIGEFYLTPGYSTEKIHIFIAQNLIPESLPRDKGEDIEVVKLPQVRVYRMLKRGEFEDAKTIIGLFYFFNKFTSGL